MPFARFVARRLAYAVLLVAVVSAGANLLARLAPGDFAEQLVINRASPEEIAQERARLGLDLPPLTFLGRWISRAVRLDFGESFRYQIPVTEIVAQRAVNTAVLASAALVVATIVGLGAATLCAGRRGWLARLVRLGSTVGVSLPPLVLAIVFAWVAATTGWVPTGGMSSDFSDDSVAARALDLARHLVVPCLALALPLAATLERMHAREMSRALDELPIRQARARGIPSARVRWRHALPMAAAPVVAVYGLLAGSLLGGAFGVEIVTAWPGLGALTWHALLDRDVPLAAGCAAAGAALLAGATFVADLVLAWLDPRIVRQ